ncbi:MAG: TolC family protein [Verrucomicrobiae bacterium]|nr:TolC family protein [Verrucomicrobiae bacterium]
MTLEEALRLALTHHPSLKAAAARMAAAAGRAEQAGRWSNPELEIRTEEWAVSRGRGFADAEQTVGIAQTLPYPGKKSLDKQLGGVAVQLAEVEQRLRRTEIVREVKAAFYRVLVMERVVEVSTQRVALAESFALTARRRVEAGAATAQEQLRAEVQLEQARTESDEWLREKEISRQSLALMLGQPELKDAALIGALAEAPPPRWPEAETEAWLERHPSVMAAQAALVQARLAHRRARLETYPDLKVSLAGGRRGETDEGIIALGFSLPLPLLDRGQGRQRESLAQVHQAEAELHLVQQQLRQEWIRARKRYQTAAIQVGRYREQLLPKAEEALHLVQQGFEEGKFTFMDLLDTQRTAAETRLAYWQKVLELHLAQAELEALLRPETPGLTSPH